MMAGGLLFVAIALGASGAPLPTSGPVASQSASGQFVAFPAPTQYGLFGMAALSADTNFIRLQPALLVVSCERIKDKLVEQLGATGPGRGKAYFHLRRARSANDPVTVVEEKSAAGWDCSVDMPDVLPRDRYLRTIVHIVLSEIANRDTALRPVEMPLWLVEGFCGELRASSEMELFLPPPTLNVHGLTIQPEMVSSRWADAGDQARSEFQHSRPLSFEQLSWPVENQLAGEQGDVYRRSAVLFVNSLLDLPDGPASFRAMLEDLHGYYNWQFAFLRGFHAHFQTSLDVEKWWELEVTHFTGRGLFDRWTPLVSLAKLQETLQSGVELRTAGDELPRHSDVDSQTVIREWELSAQAQTLGAKVAGLESLRVRVAPEMITLVDQYQVALRTYLEKRGLLNPPFPRDLGGPISDRLSAEAIRQLDALDQRRTALLADSASRAAP